MKLCGVGAGRRLKLWCLNVQIAFFPLALFAVSDWQNMEKQAGIFSAHNIFLLSTQIYV